MKIINNYKLIDIRDLKNKSGCYVLIDKSDYKTYVGASSNLFNRLKTHNILKQYTFIELVVLIYECPVDKLSTLERDLMFKFGLPNNLNLKPALTTSYTDYEIEMQRIDLNRNNMKVCLREYTTVLNELIAERKQTFKDNLTNLINVRFLKRV